MEFSVILLYVKNARRSFSPLIAPIHHGLKEPCYASVGDDDGGAAVGGHPMVQVAGYLDKSHILALNATGKTGERISILGAKIRLDGAVGDDRQA